MFSFFKNLTGGKTITRPAMDPALDKMKEHLITKNVAVEIAEKLCGSVATKLDGKVVGSFTGWFRERALSQPVILWLLCIACLKMTHSIHV